MVFDDSRQMLIEPLLEDRLQHLADHLLERIDLRRRGDARGDGLQLLERVAALPGNLFVDQRRPEIDRRRERLVELEHVLVGGRRCLREAVRPQRLRPAPRRPCAALSPRRSLS